MPTVLACTHTAPSRNRGRTGSIVCATASVSKSIVMTTSAPDTASAAVSATRAPSSARGLAFSVLRFHTVTSRPSRSRLRAIPAPMIPVPSTATVGAVLMPGGLPPGLAAHAEELRVGTQRGEVGEAVRQGEEGGDGPDVPDLLVGEPGVAGGVEVLLRERRGVEREGQGEVDDRAPAGVQRGAVGVDADVVGELGLLAAHAQDRAVGDDAVRAVVGARRGDDDQLAL